MVDHSLLKALNSARFKTRLRVRFQIELSGFNPTLVVSVIVTPLGRAELLIEGGEGVRGKSDTLFSKVIVICGPRMDG